jgi:hypothetical protein
MRQHEPIIRVRCAHAVDIRYSGFYTTRFRVTHFMWNPFKCRLFRHHDYATRRRPGFIFLECRRCGHRSHGWVMDEMRVRREVSPLRLLMADSRQAAHAIRPTHADTPRRAALDDMEALRLTFGDFRRGPVRPAPGAAVSS